MRAFVAACLAVVICAFATVGCGRGGSDSEAQSRVVTVEYAARGTIERLPVSSHDVPTVLITHEAIPAFRKSVPDGGTGMPAGTTPFEVRDRQLIADVAAGDLIDFTFEVDYRADSGRFAGFRLASIVAASDSTRRHGVVSERQSEVRRAEGDLIPVDYTTRGVVAQLPSDNDPTSEFFVRHEAIPDFRASLPDGPLGMNAMTMPFPLLRGVTLDGLEVGDKISLTFRVDYDEKTGAIQGYRVISFEELPADTELVFSSPGEP